MEWEQAGEQLKILDLGAAAVSTLLAGGFLRYGGWVVLSREKIGGLAIVCCLILGGLGSRTAVI